MNNKEKFKKEMHDYANINEYYSYFGNVIYISSSFYDGKDYFLVLRTNKALAVVTITATKIEEFSKKRTRSAIIDDLTELEPSIHWVVPSAFHNHATGLLQNMDFPDRNELLRLKQSDINVWNRYFIEDAIKKFKFDHTLLSRGINFNHTIKAGYMTTFTTAEGIYDTNFGFMCEWVTGNPFFDVKIKYFSQLKTRRLYYYDVNELADVLRALATRVDQTALAAIERFVS